MLIEEPCRDSAAGLCSDPPGGTEHLYQYGHTGMQGALLLCAYWGHTAVLLGTCVSFCGKAFAPWSMPAELTAAKPLVVLLLLTLTEGRPALHVMV